jgi:multiple sugar transport system permease protein
MAGAVLAIWPMLVIFITLQLYFVEGIAITGLKG